jgi:predicted translin family RNA/ssDNA-binding protein
MSNAIGVLFGEFSQQLEADGRRRDEIQAAVKELNTASRQLQAQLAQVHSGTIDDSALAALHARVAPQFTALVPLWERVRVAMGDDPVEKHRHLFRNTVSDLCGSAVLHHWLIAHELLTHQRCNACIGFFDMIDLEDYLLGVTGLPRELSRMCVNAVTSGNYQLPPLVQRFVADLYAAFQLLNLRNDALRKRFDGIKYELTAIEQVIYDISVHRLDS